MKNRLTNYNFWISIFSAVLLILQALKIEFDVAYVNEIFTAVLGLLVVIGIIIDPTKTTTKPTSKEKEETKSETLPIVEENEVNNINNENDFKIVLNQIASDIEQKIKELSEMKKETAETIFTFAKNEEKVEPEVQKIIEKNKVEDSQSAAAEMENPYVDLMK